MENLNSDEKMKILINLQGHEIVKVCQTSKKMQLICSDERYNPLWKNKIKNEFNIDYNKEKAFKKYKELSILYNTTYLLFCYIDEDETGETPRIYFPLNKLEQIIEEIKEEGDPDEEELFSFYILVPDRKVLHFNKRENYRLRKELLFSNYDMYIDHKKITYYDLKQIILDIAINDEFISQGAKARTIKLNKKK